MNEFESFWYSLTLPVRGFFLFVTGWLVGTTPWILHHLTRMSKKYDPQPEEKAGELQLK